MSDNSWFEKGEFPPVGTKVLYHGKETEIVAYIYCGEYQKAVYQVLDRSGCGYTESNSFEPIKADRELAIEQIMLDSDCFRTAAIKLYDAGYRKNES